MPLVQAQGSAGLHSQYAVGQVEGDIGRYGAVLLKPWTPRGGNWHVGETLPPGTIVPGEVAVRWPLINRLALRDAKFVRFFFSKEEASALTDEVSRTASLNPTRAQAQIDTDRFAPARAAKALKRQGAP